MSLSVEEKAQEAQYRFISVIWDFIGWEFVVIKVTKQNRAYFHIMGKFF